MRKEAAIMRTRLCIHPVRPELAHASVHDRISGPAALPGRELRGVAAPRKTSELVAQRHFRKLRPVEQEVIGELAPGELSEERL